MDEYKKIIKSAKTRKFILSCLRMVPDTIMLKLQYRIKLKRKLDLNNPKRFTEKVQWYKINYRNPKMKMCVDKNKVRFYVSEKGLANILTKQYGFYHTVDEISWDSLPNQFVIKTTHGGGGLNVIVCNDKNKFDVKNAISILSDGNKPFPKRTGGREWAYYGLSSGITIEELLIDENHPEAGIDDYKIFCFNGEPKYLVVDVDRYIGHKRNFYDLEWNNLNISSDCPMADREIPKPKNFETMLDISRKLSEEFPFVRVDLYNLDGKIYFGELTFYPWSGYVQFLPDAFDFELGNEFRLPDIRKI